MTAQSYYRFILRRKHVVVLLLTIVVTTTAGRLSAAERDTAEFPPVMVDFVPYEKNPVFTAAGPGHWDAKIRERGWILRDGDRYLMWYTGYNGQRTGWKALGLATSSDGIAWTRSPQNPIYDGRWTEDMMVLKHERTFYMFAEGFRHGRAYPFAGRMFDEPHLLTSLDGIRWQRSGALTFRNAAGQPLPGVNFAAQMPKSASDIVGKPLPNIFGTPAAWYEDGQWYLFYEKLDLGIWLARSQDLLEWTNVLDEPVIKPGPETYDDQMIAMNQIVKYGGRYYGYYHAMGSSDAKRWSTNVAVSDDLRTWRKYPGNPLVKNNKSSGILVPDGDRFRLYTMHDQVDLYLPRAVK